MPKKIKKLNKKDSRKSDNPLSKVKHFVQYHNAFNIIFVLVFVGFGAVFAANPEMREGLISSQDVVRSIDNSGVVSTDFDNFDFGLQIKEITEDQDNYYIVWNYKTMAINDYVWQEVQKENTLTVSKLTLGDRDLGLYVAEELGEVIDYQLSYLKEVQQIEKKNGLTQKIVATQYAGLIGQLMDTKEKVFPEYQPVVKEPEIQPQEIAEQLETFNQSVTANQQEIVNQQAENIQPPAQQSVQQTTAGTGGPIDREMIRQIVQEILAQQQNQASSQSPAEQTTIEEPVIEEPPIETSTLEPEPTPAPAETQTPSQSEPTPAPAPESQPEPQTQPQPEPTPEPAPSPVPDSTETAQ